MRRSGSWWNAAFMRQHAISEEFCLTHLTHVARIGLMDIYFPGRSQQNPVVVFPSTPMIVMQESGWMTESEPTNPRKLRLWPRKPRQRRGWVSCGVVVISITVAFAVRFSLTPLI